MYQFGSGVLTGKPVSGNTNANPTATQFGTLQDVSVDFDFDMKELYGQNQTPVAIAKAKMKIACKASFATISAKTFSDLYWGQALSAGSIGFAQNVASTIAATVTPVVPGGGTFDDDMGVFYQATGLPLVNSAAAPTQGQYTYNKSTGVYTFAVADAGAAIFFNFTYTSTGGFTLKVNNQLMGFGPEFSVFLTENYSNKNHSIRLFRCLADKLNFKTKQEDFVIPEMDFSAFSNAGGQVFEEYFSE